MNILIFGPNGSGKGTQGAIIQGKYTISHIESGAIFRKNIGEGTELGMQAKAFIEKGDLVPDDITIPMILSRLKESDCADGWILDGFPRNKVQAETLAKALEDENMDLDYVVEITLDRKIAKQRITGRRLCVANNNHPNHVAIDAIKPVEKDGHLVCRICGDELKTRPDDQDDAAIDKRHDIYYDDNTGTMAAVNFFKNHGGFKVISVDGSLNIKDVNDAIMQDIA
ncbi:MAG: adenylate kinase [Deltaproteobacteria bacterium]|nr:adenylate kinase [Deltaproteobacteria bacterium]